MCKLNKNLQIYLPKLNLTGLKYSGNLLAYTNRKPKVKSGKKLPG